VQTDTQEHTDAIKNKYLLAAGMQLNTEMFTKQQSELITFVNTRIKSNARCNMASENAPTELPLNK